MERKIGEIFEYNDEWYQCIEGAWCLRCDFYRPNLGATQCNYYAHCMAFTRSDNKSVIFKKLEKVGEPITVKGRTFQKLVSDDSSCKNCVFNVPNKACCKNSYIEGLCDATVFWVEIKQNEENMKEKKLKPFDLEAAKAGKPVCTRDGRKARIICFDAKGDKPIIALIEMGVAETPNNYPIDGKAISTKEASCDLMMLPEKKEGWVNVYDADTTFYFVEGMVYDTKEEAIKHINPDHEIYITTVKIEWEE